MNPTLIHLLIGLFVLVATAAAGWLAGYLLGLRGER